MNDPKKTLIGLKADRFRHPLDLQATNYPQAVTRNRYCNSYRTWFGGRAIFLS